MKNTEFATQYPRVYFCGIGGVSMSGLALMLKKDGVTVAGSDVKPSKATQMLEDAGIPVFYGQKAENLSGPWDLFVYTAAIHPDNPEFAEAQKRGIPPMTRAALLGQIMAQYPQSIGVAGTHGKTTTTGMMSHILLAAQTDPTITIGGFLPKLDGNTRIGDSAYFLAEACEYTDSFLELSPLVEIILNMEAEHLDYFKDMDHVRASFHAYAAKAPQNGFVVVSDQIPGYRDIVAGIAAQAVTVGSPAADFYAESITVDRQGHASFTLMHRGQALCPVTLGVPGLHNVGNAVAALAAAHCLGLPLDAAAQGLAAFTGVDRRFEYKGECNGATVIEDFAHHPTELAATLATAQLIPHHTLWCAFQPHTYSRTRDFLDNFAKVLSQADHVLLADIYAARETNDGTIHSKDLAQRINECGGHGEYLGDISAISDSQKARVKPGDLVLVLGAGDIYQLSQTLILR